ncbi:hypothetical protein DOTSEDRAFT_24953 [Dothistroma septosporum NZE10]|uniref:Uncharacterized protein n=1 Tax=Dothistroma septosporum (strain NZE10 / CBS 128990) TaxID=675120 RepID=M2YLS5_DOTSN|nr:hypothetical protein DOTSEDRAFT_24953 [Dothistroma septosporum NZE10]
MPSTNYNAGNPLPVRERPDLHPEWIWAILPLENEIDNDSESEEGVDYPSSDEETEDEYDSQDDRHPEEEYDSDEDSDDNTDSEDDDDPNYDGSTLCFYTMHCAYLEYSDTAHCDSGCRARNCPAHQGSRPAEKERVEIFKQCQVDFKD